MTSIQQDLSMQQFLVVLVNVPDEAVAAKLGRQLVQQRLAACVNLLPPVRSIYQWQGVLEEAAEVPLLIKTTRACYPQLEAAIKAAHPYDLPEIIALPIVTGLPAYLDWLTAETQKDNDV